MAKNQNLALNPQKINGVCGRLLCCLSYEDSMYSELKKDLPRMGNKVTTKSGEGIVTAVDVLNQSYTVLINGKKINITKED
jgi:cell fate regulator YaaT (PSP1 superfamily)